jgi:hypothetical protein
MKEKSKKNIHNLIILDESGSMESIRKETLSGFNELVQSIQQNQTAFPDQNHLITLVTFNGQGIKKLILRQPVDSLLPLKEDQYRPASMTPLFDAIGTSCNDLERVIRDDPDTWAVVTILTDGLENASREYTGDAIRALVTRLSEGQWTFAYIGANHDVTKVANDMNITNSMSYVSDSSGTDSMWQKERLARRDFAQKLNHNMPHADLKNKYFGEAPIPNDKVKPGKSDKEHDKE